MCRLIINDKKIGSMSRQCKILLTCKPDWFWNNCPFMGGNDCMFERDKCKCIVGPYYSESFEFDKCPYCEVAPGMPASESDVVETQEEQ